MAQRGANRALPLQYMKVPDLEESIHKHEEELREKQQVELYVRNAVGA